MLRDDKTNKTNNSNQSRIEELRARLRAKLEEKRSHRPAAGSSNGNSDTMISKRAARRAEKQRRIELAKKKQQSSGGGTTQTGKHKMEKITLVQDLGGSKISKTGDKKIEVSIDIIEIQAVRMQLSEIPNSLLFSSQNI